MATPDPFQQAFHKAKADFLNGLAGSKTNIQQDILSTTNIDQVYDTIDKLQLDHAKRGRNRNIARIQPFLEGLQSYTQAIEVFIQVKPEVLALIWGPIKLLLLWTTNTKQALDAVLNTAATIGELLPKFQRVKEIFCDDDRLKSILGLFYVDVLDFYSVSLDFFSKSRFEVFFESLWPRCRERIRVVEGFLDRHAQLLRDEVTFEHIRLEHQGRADALASFQKIQKVQLRQSFGILQTAISPRLYHDKQDWLRSRACRDTAEWLTKEDDFKKWLDISVSPEKKILWLQGIPGAGKTPSKESSNQSNLDNREYFPRELDHRQSQRNEPHATVRVLQPSLRRHQGHLRHSFPLVPTSIGRRKSPSLSDGVKPT